MLCSLLFYNHSLPFSSVPSFLPSHLSPSGDCFRSSTSLTPSFHLHSRFFFFFARRGVFLSVHYSLLETTSAFIRRISDPRRFFSHASSTLLPRFLDASFVHAWCFLCTCLTFRRVSSTCVYVSTCLCAFACAFSVHHLFPLTLVLFDHQTQQRWPIKLIVDSINLSASITSLDLRQLCPRRYSDNSAKSCHGSWRWKQGGGVN